MGNLLFGFSVIADPICFLWIVIGTVLGLFIGALPGVGPAAGCALLLSVTYKMDSIPAICLMISLYMAAMYGGSISSIVLSVPGSGASVATIQDGAPMAHAGYPGKALGYSLTASSIGGIIGCIVLSMLTAPLAVLCLKLSDPEVFLITLFGLLSVSSVSSTTVPKTMLSILLGLLMATVGLDTFTGAARYCTGIPSLYDGFETVSILIGMFAISEVLKIASSKKQERVKPMREGLSTKLTWKEIKYILPTTIWSALVGVIVGIVPALGGGTASWLCYTTAKRRSEHPETFGKGEPIGIAAPEAANNAVVGGSLIPFIVLGIPGSEVIAVVSSALIMHGIQPGPTVINNHPDLVYGIFACLFVATILMYFFGRYTTALWARLLTLPDYVLLVFVLFLGMVGSYASRGQIFDVWVTIIFGVVWYFIDKVGFSKAAFILSYILAYLFESKFRRSLTISHGNYAIFVNRPFCVVILCIIVVTFVGGAVRKALDNKTKAAK